MNRRFLLKTLIGFVFLSIFCRIALASDLYFVGYAYDMEQEALLYSETHEVVLDHEGQYLTAVVTYKSPEGRLIAEKKLDYGKNLLRPDLLFEDFRDSLKIQVDGDSDYVVLKTGKEEQREIEKLNLGKNQTVVVDAGFDRMIKQQWEELLDGEKISFKFMPLTKAKLVSFKAYSTAVSDNYLDVEIAPENFFVRMLMDPIKLRYEIESARLVRFQGVTNLRASLSGEVKEDNFQAVILYQYPEKVGKLLSNIE